MMMGTGFVLLLLLGGIVIVALVVGVGLFLGRGSNNQWSGKQHQSTARQILDERFARGEISTEEYEAARAKLEH
jgi:putative membrane protein